MEAFGNMEKYFNVYPGTPSLGVKGDYRCSVHYGNKYRLDEARRQFSKTAVGSEIIIQYTVEFLENLGIEINNPEEIIVKDPLKIDYEHIQEKNKLVSPKDIVWMKFTESGHLGVVATSNDVNFDIPSNSCDYDIKEWRYNPYKRKNELVWKHTTSGILIHQLGENWNTSFVLVFPLRNIPSGYERGDIERAVGNYLISNGKVPIIDFYSHNY